MSCRQRLLEKYRTRPRTIRARDVWPGDAVLTVHGWRRVTRAERLTGGTVTLHYGDGGRAFFHPFAPVRARRWRDAEPG